MKKALVLVAHADDESLGVGGLIQKLVKAKWNVSVVFVSDGILTVRGKIQNNKDDAERACKILGVKKPKFLGYQDQKFDTYPIADMANSIMKLNLDPDLIITHVETDLNLDHRIVLELAKIIGRPKSKPISIKQEAWILESCMPCQRIIRKIQIIKIIMLEHLIKE